MVVSKDTLQGGQSNMQLASLQSDSDGAITRMIVLASVCAQFVCWRLVRDPLGEVALTRLLFDSELFLSDSCSIVQPVMGLAKTEKFVSDVVYRLLGQRSQISVRQDRHHQLGVREQGQLCNVAEGASTYMF